MPSLVLGIRDEMENETQVLPLGADSLVGESGQKTMMTAQDGEGSAGGMHRGHTVSNSSWSLERGSLWKASWRRWHLGFI